jgi:prepilin-type N-terminal cleavage/methylation domain-containing protein
VKQTIRLLPRPASCRRGVTLVEMLVTVAVLVIIMTILVQVFQGATGALSAAQALQQIDDQLRRVDGLLRADLEGITARLTPPLDPAQNLGYFEYGENEFSDVQGEDCDDYIRFTAKAPDGRPFTGRMWVNGGGTLPNPIVQPVSITSEYAEIIYFLRNGNLYRRVLLVAPQLQSTIAQVIGNQVPVANGNAVNAFAPAPVFGGLINTSWQGMNDLSARPAVRGAPFNMTTNAGAGLTGPNSIVLNTLGDLTNRENRAFSPRFSDDYVTIGVTNGTVSYSPGPDGLSDDENSDNVPDYYPSLYWNLFNGTLGTSAQRIFETGYPNLSRPANTTTLMGFPFIFPGAYSSPQIVTSDAYGWIHAPSPFANVPSGGNNCSAVQFDSSPLPYLLSLNHNPLDTGDNLPTPNFPNGFTGKAPPGQTWWGFPTWRETLSPSWNDPGRQLNDQVNFPAFAQPNGLSPRPASTVPVNDDANLLPPMAQPANWPAAIDFSTVRRNPQPFSDGWGLQSAFMGGNTVGQSSMWAQSWEDDLIMTGVRSFDVKAYDNSLGAYVDLGWGDDFRITQQFQQANSNNQYSNAAIAQAPYLTGNYDQVTQSYVAPAFKFANGQTWNLLTQTLAHEGRMPPLVADNVLDAQFPNPTYVNPTFNPPTTVGYIPQYPNINDGTNDTFNFTQYSSNVGDDNTGVVRLRRVWDSWSTEYSRAPANGVYNNPANAADPLNGAPWGPLGSTPPIYPSYPAPYQAPLRGLQIQMRVVDPTNQRIKSLTIRQDFTDKL